MVFFFLLQRSFTALTRSLAHGDPGDPGCVGVALGAVVPLLWGALGGLGGSGQQGHCALLDPHCQWHHIRCSGWFGEGCRDALSSRGAAGAPSSWLGCGGCCTPTLELLSMDRREASTQSSETEPEAAGNPQQLLQDFCSVCSGSHWAC